MTQTMTEVASPVQTVQEGKTKAKRKRALPKSTSEETAQQPEKEPEKEEQLSQNEQDENHDSDSPKKAKVAVKEKKSKKSKKTDSKDFNLADLNKDGKLTEEQIEKLSKMTIPQLKLRLKDNNQAVSGNKTELLTRIVDCMINGGWPDCPKCENAKLKAGKDDVGVKCPGSFSKDEGHFKACSYKSEAVERTPWQIDADDGV